METIKLSVIIPVYNTENYILRALESIPKRPDIEVILINDYSTDKSVEIIQKYIKDKENYILIDLKENVGPGEARNKGIDKATGEYLFFLDSDDYFLEGINELLKKLEGDVIYVGFEYNDGKTLFKKHWKNGVIRCAKRRFIGESRYPISYSGEDVNFYHKIMKKNPNKNFTNILVWHYNYPREGSLTWESKNK